MGVWVFPSFWEGLSLRLNADLAGGVLVKFSLPFGRDFH